MTLKDYCFDGKKQLKLRDMPTDAGEYKLMKEQLTAKTGENMARAANMSMAPMASTAKRRGGKGQPD